MFSLPITDLLTFFFTDYNDDSEDDSDADTYSYYYDDAEEPSFTEPLLEASMESCFILSYFKEQVGALKARAPQLYYDLYTHGGDDFQRLVDYVCV